MQPIVTHLAVLATLACAGGAQAQTFHIGMDGGQEVPSITSMGSASVTVTLDQTTGIVTVNGQYINLGSDPIASHIHQAAVGSNGGVILPLTVTPGTPMPNSTPGATGTITGTGALNAADMAALIAGDTYVNLHSINFPAGELRGQIVASPAVPASSTIGLVALALVFLGGSWFFLRRREGTPALA